MELAAAEFDAANLVTMELDTMELAAAEFDATKLVTAELGTMELAAAFSRCRFLAVNDRIERRRHRIARAP
jgi:hypothetical protein